MASILLSLVACLTNWTRASTDYLDYFIRSMRCNSTLRNMICRTKPLIFSRHNKIHINLMYSCHKFVRKFSRQWRTCIGRYIAIIQFMITSNFFFAQVPHFGCIFKYHFSFTRRENEVVFIILDICSICSIVMEAHNKTLLFFAELTKTL